MLRRPVLLLIVLLLTVVAACSPATPETSVAASNAPRLLPVVPYGAPEIRDLQPTTETVPNCDLSSVVVKSPSFTIGSAHSVEWEIGGTMGFGVQIGSDLAPASVNLSAALEGSVARDLTNSLQQTSAWQLPGEPGYIMTYTIMWREVWQPGYIDATFMNPEPQIMRINVRYRTGIQSDIVGQTKTACDGGAAATPLPQPTDVPDPAPASSTATLSPTLVPSNTDVSGYRLCNRDAAGATLVETDQSTGVTRLRFSAPASVFLISTDPTVITFSPGSGLQPISSAQRTQYVILGVNVPNLEWIELWPGYSFYYCTYSADMLPRARHEAEEDMRIKKEGNNVSNFYRIDGTDVELIEAFP